MTHLLYIPLLIALAWEPYGEPCATMRGDTVVMHCTSGAGLGDTLPLDRELFVSVEARASGPSFWVGLALNADVPADDSYVQAALAYQVEPYTDMAEPYGVMLNTPALDCCALLKPVAADTWHRLSVRYDPENGYTVVCVDDACSGTYARLSGPPRIELLCVAVGPSTPGGGVADCAFRGLKVGRSDSFYDF